MDSSQSKSIDSATPTKTTKYIKSTNTTAVTMEQTSDLINLFECPVCFDYALPPITQCESGHILCFSCREKLDICPTCRRSFSRFGKIRNLAMEKIAANIQFPCKFSSNGCKLTFHPNDKHGHEDTCIYRTYNCPCPGTSCKWQGSLDGVMNHLSALHKSITTLSGEDIIFLATDIKLTGAVDWVMMQSCFGSHFMLILEKQHKADSLHYFYAVVQMIGTPKQAENFTYRMELNTPNRRRMVWESTPRSIHDGIQSAINESDCLSFDCNVAYFFSKNGNLAINVTIAMTS